MQSEYSIYEQLLSQVMSLPKPIRWRLARTVLAEEFLDESISPLHQEPLVYKEPKYNVRLAQSPDADSIFQRLI